MIDCICGFGNDGKHTVGEVWGMRYVGCPYAPPGMMYLIDPQYVVVTDNIGTGDAKT